MKYFMVVPYALQIILKLFFESLTASEIWKSVPWLQINWTLAGLLIAFVIHDITDPKSWIRENWRLWFGKFEIANVIPEYRNINEEGDPNRVVLVARLRFKRAVKNAEVLVYATWHGVHNPNRELIGKYDLGNVVKGEEKKLDLAVRFILGPGREAYHSVFGGDVSNIRLSDKHKSLGPGWKGFIEIEVVGETHGFFVYSYSDRKREDSGFIVIDDAEAALALSKP